jgi:3-mercaptopyruvate sulfurtransferase SseA
MGWPEVLVLVASGNETSAPETPILGTPDKSATIGAAALSDLMKRHEATVVDLSFSRDYLAAHIPGAWFVIRSRLEQFIQREPLLRNVVLTSEDGVLASLAARETRAWTPLAVHYLEGGNAAWRAAGLPFTADDPRMADQPIDAWLKPYERPDGVKQAMVDYLAWETDLLPRIARDGCAKFEVMR